MTWQQTAHNPEVAGSNPAPATTERPGDGAFLVLRSNDPDVVDECDPGVSAELPAPDDEADAPAGGQPRSRPRALSDDAADSSRAGVLDAPDRAVRTPNAKTRPRERHSDHSRHVAAHCRRWRQRRWRRRRRRGRWRRWRWRRWRRRRRLESHDLHRHRAQTEKTIAERSERRVAPTLRRTADLERAGMVVARAHCRRRAAEPDHGNRGQTIGR